MKIAFVDTETTGLDFEKHEVWDIALLVVDHEDLSGETTAYEAKVMPDLKNADPNALRMNHFYERVGEAFGRRGWVRIPEPFKAGHEVAHEVALLTDGAFLAGMNVPFDDRFLEKFLRSWGFVPAWQYKPIEIESMMLGWLANRGELQEVTFPYSSSALSRMVGVNPDDYDRHTALGDCLWARDVYEAMMRP